MIELYHTEECPYCVKVRLFLEKKAIPYVSKPVGLRTQGPLKEELRRIGGKVQVPFLVDPDRKIQMYESEDIIKYLDLHYSPPSQGSHH